ncbi:MAG: hypothetical protein GY854_05225 [Deltaproteobacteria bacterium]|nr:hypothetical protein [Deltaproteobacteria bacterium]
MPAINLATTNYSARDITLVLGLVSQTDYLASFAPLLNVDIPAGNAEDSLNVLPNILGLDHEPIRKEFVVLGHDGWALRQGDWKYHREGNRKKRVLGFKLYNLKEDISETNNLSDKYPDKVERMSKRLGELLENFRQNTTRE